MSRAQDILEQLNTLDEHSAIETKLGLGDSVLETICALANEPGLKGGTIIIGVRLNDKMPVKELMRWVQVTHEDSFNAVVEWMDEPSDVLVMPGEEDCDDFYHSNNDVPDPETMTVLEDRLKYFEKITQSKPKEQIPENKTLGFFIDRYVLRHRKRCDAGEISVDRVDKVNYDLGKFGLWFGRDRSIMEIDIHVVEDFYNWLLDRGEVYENSTVPPEMPTGFPAR